MTSEPRDVHQFLWFVFRGVVLAGIGTYVTLAMSVGWGIALICAAAAMTIVGWVASGRS